MELITYLSIINRRKWIVIGLFVILFLGTVVAVRLIPPKYTSTAELRVMTPRNGGTNYLDYNTNYAAWLMNTYATLITSDQVQSQLIKDLKLSAPPDVTASVIADSELIKITAQARDPQLSAAIADSAANLLVNSSVMDSTNLQKNQETAFNLRFTQLDNELSQARNANKELMIPYTQDNSSIASLNGQITSDQQLYLTLLDRYVQNLPLKTNDPADMATLNTQINDLKNQITQEKVKLDALNAKVANESVQISATQGEITLKEQEYTNLLAQQDQLNTIQTVQGTNNLTIVAQATPPTSPSYPNIPLVYALGAVISLFLAVLVAFVVDSMDDTLHSSNQIEAVTHSTPLGKIPFTKHSNQPINPLENDASQTEDMARLQLNLQRISQLQALKSILISSPSAQEDQSLLSARLAHEIVKTGERVLVVDANLRMPSLHTHFLRVKNDDGLSQVLMGRVPVEHAIKDSGITNLYVLPAGPILNNPGLFLGSEKMKALLEQLKSVFSTVIVNAAPILSTADADALATYVDGVILVVERGKTQRGDLSAAVKHLGNLRAHFIGCVVNRAEAEGRFNFQARVSKAKKMAA